MGPGGGSSPAGPEGEGGGGRGVALPLEIT